MSDTPTSEHRSFSPMWALLLLPIGLGVGWLVGGMPMPKSHLAQTASMHGAAAVGASVESPRPEVTPSGSAVTDAHASDALPGASEPKPEQQPKRAEYSQWTSLESAMAESERSGKPILLDFNADWCPPCQAMKREVFEDGARGQSVQTAVIPVSIVDRTREDGANPPEIENLQRRFQVTAFPTLVVFSPANGQIMQTKGFGGAEATLEWINQAAKAVAPR